MFVPDNHYKLDQVKRWKDQYPRLTAFWVTGVPGIFIWEPEDLEVILGSPLHITKGIEYDALIPWLQEGLLLSSGDKWHKRRKLLTPAFHFRILEDNLQGINKHAKTLVRNLLNKQDEVIVIENYITLCTLDVICETAMGFSLNCQDNQGNEYVDAVKRVSHLVITKILKVWLRRKFIFYLLGYGREFSKCLSFLHNFTENIIKERKVSFKAKKIKQCLEIANEDDQYYGSKKRKAFLDSLIELDMENPNLFTNKDIREEVDTFMFEGHDTTSSALTFAIFQLGCNPDIQEKVHTEMYNIFEGSDREATLKDLQKMHYLEKVIKETLRLYPSVPYMSRTLIQDLELDGGVVVPAGVNAVIVTYWIHRNPRFFPNPEVFDPDRFSPMNCKNRHPYSYIPFSAGPRNCIGQKFAMMELKVVLSTLIRFCKIESVTKPEDITVLPLLILRSNPPIRVKITARQV